MKMKVLLTEVNNIYGILLLVENKAINPNGIYGVGRLVQVAGITSPFIVAGLLG